MYAWSWRFVLSVSVLNIAKFAVERATSIKIDIVHDTTAQKRDDDADLMEDTQLSTTWKVAVMVHLSGSAAVCFGLDAQTYILV